MKIRRWAGRGVSAVAVGGALVLMTACGGKTGTTEVEVSPAVATAPSVKATDMVKSETAATNYLNITTMQTFGAGCGNEYQCQAALNVLQPFVSPLAEALDEEAGKDPYWKEVVELADKVSAGVQGTAAGDQEAMRALLKDVVRLKEQLQEKELGHV